MKRPTTKINKTQKKKLFECCNLLFEKFNGIALASKSLCARTNQIAAAAATTTTATTKKIHQLETIVPNTKSHTVYTNINYKEINQLLRTINK